MQQWNDVNRALLRGEEIDFGLPVVYPIRKVGNGAFATVFKTADNLILRLSSAPLDHKINGLSGHVSWMPKIHHSAQFPDFSVMLRDDINPASTDKSVNSLANKLTTFTGCRPSPSDVEHAFQSLITVVDNLRENFPGDEDDAARLIDECRENICEFGKEIGCRKSSYLSINEDGIIFDDEALNRDDDKLNWMYAEICNLVLDNLSSWPQMRKILEFHILFIQDTGQVAHDCGHTNLSLSDDGDVVFRDPYYMAVRVPDFEKRVGAHRQKNGLNVPENWDVDINHIDAGIAHIWLMEDTDFTDAVLRGASYPENLFVNHKSRIMVATPEIAQRFKEYISGIVPVASIRTKMFTPDKEQTQKVLDELGYYTDASNVSVRPVFLQEFQEAPLKGFLNSAIEHLQYCAHRLKQWGPVFWEWVENILQGNKLDKESIEHIRNKYTGDEDIPYLLHAIQGFETALTGTNTLSRVPMNDYFRQAAFIFKEVYNHTGVALGAGNFTMEDDLIKVGFYSPRHKKEYENVKALVGERWVSPEMKNGPEGP